MRPYYVEHPSERITHEVWAADGTEMAMMKLDPAGFVDGDKGEYHTGHIIIGDKDGRHFDIAAQSRQLLHPCLSRDRILFSNPDQNGIAQVCVIDLN